MAPPRWRWGAPLAPLVELLARGGLLAIPTESSYGLAVDPSDGRAVNAVYRLKGRQRHKPLPVVAADLGQLAALGVDVEAPAFQRLAAAWPAPLTVVVAVERELPAAAGSGSLAVRIPAHERLRGLLSGLGRALTATSANRSGEPPLLEPEPVRWLLAGREAAVIDGGALAGGEPSTVVALERGALRVLRRGRFPLERLPLPKGLESAGAPPRNRSGSSRC